jgi:hypothetical protein
MEEAEKVVDVISYGPTAGTANTGGGAGGGNASYKGTNGGSGIVVIRFYVPPLRGNFNFQCLNFSGINFD